MPQTPERFTTGKDKTVDTMFVNSVSGGKQYEWGKDDWAKYQKDGVKLDRNSVHTGDVNHRNSNFARLRQQFLNMRQRIPTRKPTATRPRPDRIDHGLGFVAENPAVEIYQ